jgi:5'-methylthioadenosine phosphorylase
MYAIIGGSGLARLTALEAPRRQVMRTPYGEPSGAMTFGRLADADVVFLARHGYGHTLAPHEINYRANVWALEQRGVRRCVGINTVGAIERAFVPGELAVPDQLIDYTHGRAATYGGAGAPVRHIELTEPFAPLLRGRLSSAVADCGFAVRGGTYGCTQGPRLETAAEIERLRRDGCAMVGMTAMPEAALARELDVEYAVCAVAVNYAAGRAPDGAPIAGQIDRFMGSGLAKVRAALERLVGTV